MPSVSPLRLTPKSDINPLLEPLFEKPLPAPPASPSHAPQNVTRPTTSSNSSTASRRRISFHPPTHISSPKNLSTLLAVVQHPGVLTAFIGHLDWPGVYNLLSTCKTSNALFNIQPHRDVILCRFVPGYIQSLYDWDLDRCQNIPVSLSDLDLLLISQRVPLHRYPMQALKTLSSLYPSVEADETNAKFAALANAHSRFVLMLQALVHSSSTPIATEPEEVRCKSHFTQVDNIRQLTFPAPLSYTPKTEAPITHVRHKSKGSITSDKEPSFTATHPLSAANPPRPSADSLSSMMSKERTLTKGRLSIFGRRGYEIPPPAELRALKIYSTSRKRSTFLGDPDDLGVLEEPLERPHRHFASMNGSSDSSISGSPPPQFSSSPWRNSDTGGEFSNSNGAPPLRMTSPHDLSLATSRSRAPVLRVFVPCTTLDEASESVLACEQQLVDAGLWDHLSIGDIVCNLGYVPPAADESSSDGSDQALPGDSQRTSRSPPLHSDNNVQRTWLLFNGEYLVPYTPPDVLPLEMPLNLPSPFYYAHIMPAYANPVFAIAQLPVCDDVPQLTLMHLTSKVRSPHSPKGVALVKKHAWTARVVMARQGGSGDEDMDMGGGWFGEWVLEGEGTMEGRRFLVDALGGCELGRRVCELVREKSGNGRLWIKLLHT